MIFVKLFTRAGCHLCDEVKLHLDELKAEFPHELQEIDIESTPELAAKYSLIIPVVEIGPYTMKAPINKSELRMTLGAETDRQAHIQILESPSNRSQARFGGKWTDGDRLSLWLSRHYMAVITVFVLIYLGLPILAPYLMAAGAETPAKFIYRAYRLVCHELAYRSFFLFGDQVVYPRAAAGLDGLVTFNQATGLSEGNSARDIFQAEDFIGNEQVGYKIALCQRDVAIYVGILAFGLVFILTNRRLPPLPWYLWLALGIFPIALDGFSQLLSQPPISLFPYRESTPFLRILTGGMFGFFTAWFGIPILEESMVETRKFLANKRSHIANASV